MQFSGFPNKGLRFLSDLAANNEREWFQRNKQIYQEFVQEPAKSFAAEMEIHLAEITQRPLNSKLFRIYRDVRFSKDKTPYNTHIHISFFCAGDGRKSCGEKPAFHFGLETDKVIIGNGCFDFSKDALKKYRDAVANEKTGPSLSSLLGEYLNNGAYRLDDPTLKRIPPGYDKDHPRGELLKRKGLVLWHEAPHSDAISSTEFMTEVMDGYQKMSPVYHWLNQI